MVAGDRSSNSRTAQRAPPSRPSLLPQRRERVHAARLVLQIRHHAERVSHQPANLVGEAQELTRVDAVLPTLPTLALLAERLEVELFDLLTFPAEGPRQQLVDLTRQLKPGTLRHLVREVSG